MVLGIDGKTREKKGDEPSRGTYAFVMPVDELQPKHPSLRLTFLHLWPAIALPFIAACLMLAQHFFYAYLNEKSFDSAAAELPPLLQDQNNVNFIGTTIAHAARIVLSMAICAVFAQLFWETLRSRAHTIRQIDALIKCGRSPFHHTAFRAAATSFALFTISLIASATALIVVLTPGSLTVSPDNGRKSLCTVASVPQGAMEFFVADLYPIEPIAVMAEILALNSYLPPFQTGPASTCGYATCSYNISFDGPALSCVDVTNETDFSFFLNPDEAPPSAPFPIWNASFFGMFESAFGVTILSKDLLEGTLQATNCTINRATFDAVVTLTESTSLVQVWNTVSNGSNIVMDNSFISIYGQIGVIALEANLYAGPNGYTTDLSSWPTGSLQNNPFFVTTTTGNHTFSDTPAHFAETFIQNAALSLLSGNVYYGVSNDTASNLERVNTTCSSLVTFYVYDSSRLLSTYGAILGIGAVVIVYGCWLTLRNGPEKRLSFSDVIRIALNEDMLALSGELAGQCRVQLQSTGRAPGRLLSLSPVDYETRTSSFKPKPDNPRALPWTSPPKSVSVVPWKLVLLILAALCCMALNHAYYHYLNGRAPISSLNSSDWLQNQTAASDIGIALAYACQTLLAIAIATSCVQLFWRTLRSRGIAISQIDALMEIQAVSFPRSMCRALRASWGVTLLSLLAASTSLVSIFAPGSVKVSPNSTQLQTCAVLIPRNLSAIETTLTDYWTPIAAGILSGTYLQPADPCPASQCSYDLEFVGPGFDCQDVTASSNFTAFNGSFGVGFSALYRAEVLNQTSDLTMRVFVQTWDVKRSVYQAVNCTGVTRSYSVSIISGTISPTNIIVTDSRILGAVHANVSQLSTFAETYLYNMMTVLAEQGVFKSKPDDTQLALTGIETQGIIEISATFPFSTGSSIGRFELDSSISMSKNLTLAMEEFAQNSTLSLLSDTVFAFNSDNPNLLENTTTACAYQLTAYEYLPYRLFVTYGVAIFVTILCAIWGTIAIKQNGVEESLDFSRVLRAVLNEEMFNARDTLDKGTVIKADVTEEGSLAPLNY